MMIITASCSTTLQNLMLWLLLISIYGGHWKFAGGANCLKDEQTTLLEFKAELIDEYGLLSGWNNLSNCCEWYGVGCDNRTNRVVALDLRGTYEGFLRGKISPSLLQLHHLEYLDLSNSHFSGITIPNFIGSFTKLQHLNLSVCFFFGPIPHHLGNLSMLKSLDLGFNFFAFIESTNIGWLSGFKSLEYLDLSSVTVGSEIFEEIHKLPALEQIYLSECGLTVVEPLWLNYSNSLVVLDLSANYIDGIVTNVFRNLTSLSKLDLSGNQLDGDFPSLVTWLQGSTGLKHLDLNGNQLTGSFPNMSRFSALKELYLQHIS